MAAGHCDAALVGASIRNDISQTVSHGAGKVSFYGLMHFTKTLNFNLALEIGDDLSFSTFSFATAMSQDCQIVLLSLFFFSVVPFIQLWNWDAFTHPLKTYNIRIY